MIRVAGRRVFDRLEGGLAGLAFRHPRPSFLAAAALGSLRNGVSRRWPSPGEVRTLFPSLSAREAASIAWRIGGLEARNRLLVRCIQRAGFAAVAPLVCGGLAALRPPLVLGTFHVGAMNALGPVLHTLGAPVLSLRQSRLSPAPEAVRVVPVGGDEQSRAAAFQRALAHLAAGGFVVSALDMALGSGLDALCLERKLVLARGPFALSRLTGAPIVPLAARWRRGRVEVVAGEALAPAEVRDGERWEAAAAAVAARWLERYLLGSPAEVSLGLLRLLLTVATSSPAGAV